MRAGRIAVAALFVMAAGLAVACGGGKGNEEQTQTAEGTSAAAPSASATRGTPSPGASGTPGTAAAGSATAPAPTGGTPAPGATAPAADATFTAGGDPRIVGGDPNAPQQVVATIPAPPPGVTPAVDPTEIAPPNPPSNDLQLYVDLDASQPGIQSSRTVNVGDVFRVAVVAVNVPAYTGSVGGLAAFNFIVEYDKTKVVAPTIENGPSVSRNPALNVAALGGEEAQWSCLPAPEGDLDDPGGIEGDGNPATGQALLSCFTPATGHASGTLVLGVVEFHAVAAGSSNLHLTFVELDDVGFDPFAICHVTNRSPDVPCNDASVTVE